MLLRDGPNRSGGRLLCVLSLFAKVAGRANTHIQTTRGSFCHLIFIKETYFFPVPHKKAGYASTPKRARRGEGKKWVHGDRGI
ncbi:hypothetical protein [Pandoravirus japonicus]|uniref:Uncharacterized protein n=1 Tax=Pandoravirus japonicus TaxID=2823154 RepID=A0A811BQK1_9VIRU|nr:hypothetical protein [Pandoravirus japonicus]